MIAYTLTGKNAIITGASRGLGATIAKFIWEAGANLLLVARNKKDLDSIVANIGNRPQQKIYSLSVDLSSPAASEIIVDAAKEYFSNLDILVNNAAIQGPVGQSWKNDWDSWNTTLRIDLLAPVDLSRRCAAWMIAQREGKIICLSGGGATSSRPNFSAYAVAKTGLVRFCEVLSDELYPYNIQVNCIAPGIMATGILDDIKSAGPELAGEEEYSTAQKVSQKGEELQERPAQLAVFLASPASDGITGKLISAVWDPWENFPKHLDDLHKNDIYTLRRIIPKDRGQSWGDV